MIDVAIVIIYYGDRILLTKRSPNLRTFPNQWCFVGGKIDDGETFKQGLVREIREEIGICIPEERLTPITIHYKLDGYNVSMFVTHINTTKLKVNQDEIGKWGFYDIFDTPHLEFMTNDIVEHLKELHEKSH